MDNLADLMQRLLEIHSGERRTPKLIAEDEQLMNCLQKRHLAENSSRSVQLIEEDPFAARRESGRTFRDAPRVLGHKARTI